MAETLLWHILVLALWVAVLALLTSLLRKRSAHVRYLLWTTVLIKCLTPPLIVLSLAVLPADNSLAGSEGLLGLSPSLSDPGQAGAYLAQSSAWAQLLSNPIMLAVIIWGLGIVFMLLRLGWQARRQTHFLKFQRLEPGREIHARVEGIARRMGFSFSPRVWLVPGQRTPFVFGCFRGSLYLPARTGFFAQDGFEHMVGHELSHMARWDPLLNGVQLLVQTVYWFHPLVWWAQSRIRNERELCCDEMVVARLNTQSRAYGRALLASLRLDLPVQTQGVLSMAGNPKQLERRIRTLSRPGASFSRGLGRLSLLTLLPLSLGAALVSLELGACGAEHKSDGLIQVSEVHTISKAAHKIEAKTPASPKVPELKTQPTLPQGWPTQGRITSAFGPRRNPFKNGRVDHHRGTDIAARTGEPVKATASGRVLVAGPRGAMGLTVDLDHGRGVRTRYCHLGTLEVSPGDRVAQDQVIGKIGMSGKSTGPHVHYEILVDGQAVDPKIPAPQPAP